MQRGIIICGKGLDSTISAVSCVCECYHGEEGFVDGRSTALRGHFLLLPYCS